MATGSTGRSSGIRAFPTTPFLILSIYSAGPRSTVLISHGQASEETWDPSAPTPLLGVGKAAIRRLPSRTEEGTFYLPTVLSVGTRATGRSNPSELRPRVAARRDGLHSLVVRRVRWGCCVSSESPATTLRAELNQVNLLRRRRPGGRIAGFEAVEEQ